ncbi:uncharacterized protein LOC131483279 [Ochotona princeps]|uniref:uncharacterized protein LOC131483279 n=1 Tax=Ochotona princeps TaxID=9978 RepID=UPI00271519F7|nr:uncharacterized protein LOC131483279 [Ochotona princeps]
MQGPGGGSYFYFRGEEQGELRGIRVFVGLLGLIKGVQLQFGGHWSARYGAPGGHAHEFLLQAGERVTAVEGSARACIRYLRWTTSRGRQAAFGSPGGQLFSSQAPIPGQQLLTTNGQHRLLCLSGIGFKWGFVQEAPTSASTVASTLSPTTAPRPEISPVSTLLPTTAPSSAPTLTSTLPSTASPTPASTLPSMVALSPAPIPVPTLAFMVDPGPEPIPAPTLPSMVDPSSAPIPAPTLPFAVAPNPVSPVGSRPWGAPAR